MFLYFDCFSGISGDMALGALLDCGVPLDELRQGLASLPVEGWQIDAAPVLVSGIHALDVKISLHGLTDAEELALAQTDHKHEHHHHDHDHHHEHDEHSHGHAHPHDHDHGHSHDHVHEHDHDHHHHDHHHGRSLVEIRAVIGASELSERVKATSLAIFEKIAEAEAKMHHTTLDEVHFHEIGGVDSLLDICGVAWCLEYLGVTQVHCSALPSSTGFVDCAHGRMPVPAPATLHILQGVPLYPTELRGELITPTGAAIVAVLSQSFGPPPAYVPRKVGHGSGKKRFANHPNLLRVVLGETAQGEAAPSAAQQPTIGDSGTRLAGEVPAGEGDLAGLQWQTLSVIESNIDDMNPELFDYVMARLFEAGALDVWLQAAQMKKNRPATVLRVLCQSAAQNAVITTVLRETSTLGVRVHEVRRAALQREFATVATKFGEVRLKIARWDEENLRRAVPEYEDVARLAAQHGVAAREVYEAALQAGV